MDERMKIMGVEALPHITLEKKKQERLKIEAIPEPEKKSLFAEKIDTLKATLEGEVNLGISNIVKAAAQQIRGFFNVDMLFEQAEQIYRKSANQLVSLSFMIAHLEKLREGLENEARSWDVSKWQNRFASIDNEIQTWTAKIPKPFNASMINTETMGTLINGSKDLRFPADRVGMADNKYYDKWLTDALKSKPVFLEPHERYVEHLIRFYNEVYVVEAEREKKTAEQQAIAQEKAAEQAKNQPVEPVQDDSHVYSELADITRQREEVSSLWQGSRRYRG